MSLQNWIYTSSTMLKMQSEYFCLNSLSNYLSNKSNFQYESYSISNAYIIFSAHPAFLPLMTAAVCELLY